MSLTPALVRDLEAFDAEGVKTSLERVMAGSNPLSATQLVEFLSWGVLGTTQHGLPVKTAAARNPNLQPEADPATIQAFFKALSETVFQRRDSETEDRHYASRLETNSEFLLGRLKSWAKRSPERAIIMAEAVVEMIKHVPKGVGQTLLNGVLNQESIEEAAAKLERLTQPDVLDVLAQRKVAFPPASFVLRESLIFSMDDEGEIKATDQTPGRSLAPFQDQCFERVLAHPVGPKLLRLDLNPLSSFQALMKGSGQTPQRTADAIALLIPYYEAAGKTSHANALASMVDGPLLERTIQSMDAEKLTAFFRDRPDFKPAEGWNEVFSDIVRTGAGRSGRALTLEGVTLSERQTALAGTAAFLEESLKLVLPHADGSKAIGDIERSLESVRNHFQASDFVRQMADSSTALDAEQRVEAIERLKLMLANPVLDLLEHQAAALRVIHERRAPLPDPAVLLVTLLNADSPSPRRKPRLG